jgi:hypothetical protein
LTSKIRKKDLYLIVRIEVTTDVPDDDLIDAVMSGVDIEDITVDGMPVSEIEVCGADTEMP